MILISHRGNLNGPSPKDENRIYYIEKAIKAGFDVEIDLWIYNKELFLGHDTPQYPVSLDWLLKHDDKLWIHCKNLECLEYMNSYSFMGLNYFFHESDEATLTSMGYMWCYPGNYINEGITVCLKHNDIPEYVKGVCSDEIIKYEKENS